MRYKCRKISDKLIIDGNLRKVQWETAEGILLVDTVTGVENDNQTIVKFLWDDTFLYAGFYCKYEQINATKRGFNEKLYEEDVVEVFIDDNRDRKTYMEIEVNPLNAVLHYDIHNDLAGTILQYARVNNNIISAVIQDQKEKEFMVEFAIPFTEFITAPGIPPEIGDIWLFNAYRINNSYRDDVEYLACSPTGIINFHIPNCFGELIFCSCACELNSSQQEMQKYFIEKDINQYIKENYFNPDLNVSMLGKTFHLTPAYLSKIYKCETGNSLLYAINSIRIEASKKLLAETELSVNQIAKLVGYLYCNAFIRFFKKQTGLTPGQYRNLNKKQKLTIDE